MPTDTERMETDAARYRWIRDRIDAETVRQVAGLDSLRGQAYEPYSQQVDAAIDAAMGEEKRDG